MTLETGPQAADKPDEQPEEHTAEVIPIRPEAAEVVAEEQDAEVIALRPGFEKYTQSSVAGELERAPQDAKRADMAADARAKIAALTDDQLVDAHDFYVGVAERSKSPWKYQAEAQNHADEIQRRGVSMDDIRPNQTTVAAPTEQSEPKVKKGIFGFLRRD